MIFFLKKIYCSIDTFFFLLFSSVVLHFNQIEVGFHAVTATCGQ